LLEGDPDELGLRLAQFVLGVFESEQSRGQVIGIVRSAASEPEAARLVRELLTREVLTPLAEGIGVADAEFRAGLLGSQVVGMVMARYIVAIEPLASRDAAEVALAIAPNLQHYLTGDLRSLR
ncbi:MAG: TetR/AcrR family transcriptional regulator, partial [Cellulomonas sp.]